MFTLSGTAFSVYGQQPPAPARPVTPAQPAAPKPSVPVQPSPTEPSTPAPTPPPIPKISASDFLDQKMSLGDGVRQWHPTRRILGIEPVDGDVSHATVNAAKLTAYLKKLAPNVRRRPRDARVVVLGQYAKNSVSQKSSSTQLPVKILPSVPGATLDIPGSVKAIQDAVAGKPTVTHIVLAVKEKAPRVTEERFKGIDARIGHFVTRFNPGEVGRTQTVRLAINLINGHFVQPGQTFSVNQSVGERTAARGFGTGKVFISGKMETQQGGGMCQVATTLFNAALLGDLKIVDRQQHVRTVPYVKPGDDATVYWGQKDFKFENDTSAPLYISYVTTATHCICDLYGKKTPGRTVSIVDNSQRLGPRHYTAVLRRYVTVNGKRVVDYTAHSAYRWTPALDYSR